MKTVSVCCRCRAFTISNQSRHSERTARREEASNIRTLQGLSGIYFSFPQPFNALFLLDPADRFTDEGLFWLSQLHFGRFGWFAEAVWTLFGLVPAILAFTGVFICSRRVIYKKPMQHHGVAGADLARGPHDGDHRSAATGVFGARVERRLQTVGVEARDMVDDDPVQTRGGRRVVIVGQI